jgi:hypothetical protein
MVFKNKLTPLSKGGRIDKVAGKGSDMAAMPDRREIKQLANSGGVNNYAKATPAMPAPGVRAPFGTSDLG